MLDKSSDKISEVTLIPSSGGVFEVTLGGDLVYSKKATGEFPEPKQVLDKIAAG